LSKDFAAALTSAQLQAMETDDLAKLTTSALQALNNNA